MVCFQKWFFRSVVFFYVFVSVAVSYGADNVVVHVGSPSSILTDEVCLASTSSVSV